MHIKNHSNVFCFSKQRPHIYCFGASANMFLIHALWFQFCLECLRHDCRLHIYHFFSGLQNFHSFHSYIFFLACFLSSFHKIFSAHLKTGWHKRPAGISEFQYWVDCVHYMNDTIILLLEKSTFSSILTLIKNRFASTLLLLLMVQCFVVGIWRYVNLH